MDEKLIADNLGRSNSKQPAAETANDPATRLMAQPAQLQRIFASIPEAVIFVDQDGLIQNMNLAAVSLLGEPDESLRLEEWPEKFGFYLDDARTHYPENKMPLVRALQGETVHGEEMILQRDPKEAGVWISMASAPYKDDDGRIQGAIALLRDVTHRKQIEISQEKHIKRTEMLYRASRSIAEAGNDLRQITRLAAHIAASEIGDLSILILLNPRTNRLKVASFHDITPTGQALLRKSLPPDAEFDYTEGLSRGVIRSGEPVLIPAIPAEQLQAISWPPLREIIRELHLESVLIVPLVGRSGVLGTINLYRYQGSEPFDIEDQSFMTDMAYRIALAIENSLLFDELRAEVSERQFAERALDISEERFRAIFESTTFGIKVLDLDGHILQINSAFQRMMGYSEKELLGAPFFDFIHQNDSERAARLFQGLKTSGIPYFRFEHRVMDKDQSILWVKTVFSAVKRGGSDNEPAFIVGIVENITEQKRIEMEMAELNSRLQNSMELERLRLAQELHDNPMQALYSAIYRIEELRTKADPELRTALETVTNDVKNVLQGLRATAKELRPPTIFNFGLENAIRSHTDDFEEKHPDINIKLSLAHDQQLLPEKVRLALFRVFQQTLANVLRHSEATEVQVRFAFDAEEAQLEISDNGKGFEVPSNWIEFVRQGHYGLAGAAERVHTLGGSFQVESQPGHSTVVRAIIPWRDSIE